MRQLALGSRDVSAFSPKDGKSSREAAALCTLALASAFVVANVYGCTSLLDIDHEYALENATGGTGGDVISGGSGGDTDSNGGMPSWDLGGMPSTDSGAGGTGAAPAIPTGGVSGVPASGGAIGVGGHATGGSGAEASSGGAPATGGEATGAGGSDHDAGPSTGCETGIFTGTFSGSHRTSITAIGVPFQVSGDVRFRLEGPGPNELAVAEASFTGTMDFIPTPMTSGQGGSTNVFNVPYTATMSGSYDCKSKKLTGTLENGKFSNPDAQSFFKFAGTYTATLGPSDFTGTWNEAELIGSVYAGSGTFTAKRTGP